jgi:hypothetical protein
VANVFVSHAFAVLFSFLVAGLFISLTGSSTFVKCEFEADRDDEKDAVLKSSVIKPSEEWIRISYYISSPDIHIQLTFESESNGQALGRHLLEFGVGQFEYKNNVINQPYIIVIRAVRVCAARCNSDSYVLLWRGKAQGTVERGRLSAILINMNFNYSCVECFS